VGIGNYSTRILTRQILTKRISDLIMSWFSYAIARGSPEIPINPGKYGNRSARWEQEMIEDHTENQKESQTFDVVAIAASAGGLTALSFILNELPAEFPAAIVIVQHLDPRHRSLMADILSRRTSLNVKQAQFGDHLKSGQVFIAPPNYHLLVNKDGSLDLTQTELVHFVRPSADLLFESVAGSSKSDAIGVVLTGNGSDGSMGVKAINKMGGTVIVQHPDDAEFNGMPNAAIQTHCADFILTLEEIPPALINLIMQE
jgi:two-component system, chemotaxis family, protein-glutamate methylesterase/glutaminase